MVTVLIVDDEPNVIDLVRITLEDDRVRVLDASDAATALACLSETRPDLVFLDVNLPDLSGLDICRRIRADGVLARTKVVMLTAAAQREDVVRGREPGEVLAEEAAARHADLVVVGARRHRRKPFGRTVESVLRLSPCRVLVIAAPAEAVPSRAAA